MRCRRVRDKLSAFIDGEVQSNVVDAINDHLQQCSECRDACARLQKLEIWLDESTVPPVPRGLTERIVASAGRDVASPIPNRIAPAPVPALRAGTYPKKLGNRTEPFNAEPGRWRAHRCTPVPVGPTPID